MPAAKKPAPIAKNVVCSCCGLAWDRHGKEPGVDKCVELLKADLAKRPHYSTNGLGISTAASGLTWTVN